MFNLSRQMTCTENECSLCRQLVTVYPKKYAHGFCFAVLCCGYTLTDFPISIRLTSLALWQSNHCPSASKATLMNMDKYFMWIHYERLHNHNKAKHNKPVCIFLGIYCILKTDDCHDVNLFVMMVPYVVQMTIFSPRSDDNIAIVSTLGFRCKHWCNSGCGVYVVSIDKSVTVIYFLFK